jgi:putative MATE family efflux protein
MTAQPGEEGVRDARWGSTWHVTRELGRIAWPIVGLNVLTVLALAVDTAMCGRLEDAEVALTGLGFATQILFLLTVGMIGLSVGTVASVARAYGAGQLDRVQHILGQATWLTVALGVFIALFGNAVAAPLLGLLGASGPSLAVGLDYVRPLLWTATFTYLSILYGAVLRGTGDTRTAFYVALAGNGLNVVLNYGFILGNLGLPAWGVWGAAFGTMLSRVFSSMLLLLLLTRGVIPGVRFSWRWPTLDRPLAARLVSIGMPAAIDMMVLNAAFLTIIGMLGRIDEVAVAAHGLGLRIQALAFVPGLGVSQAIGALVGQRLGAGDAQGARAVVRVGIVVCAVIMGLLGASIIAAVDQIVVLFGVVPGTELAAFSEMWIWLLGMGLPAAGVYIALVGMLQGAGATRVSLRINLVVTMLLQIPASWVLGFPLGWGAFGVWAAFPASFVFKSIAGLWAYRFGGWARVGAD